MSVCDKVIAPAEPGQYELHVTHDGSTDSVHGAHGLDGAEIETWTHQDLVPNGPQIINVNPGDEHVILVFATFTNDDTFTIDLKRDGATVATCILTKDGHTSSSMSLITVGGA